MLQPIPPTRFGKYTLIGKLGHGGMAEVLLAVVGGLRGFRKLTVVKRLHAHLAIESGFVDMFLDEARLAAQLDHPNCVQTLELGETEGQHFLSMEYLDGQGLERLLRSSAQSGVLLPTAVVARIIADALDGLAYAHDLVGFDGKPLGVVHRDISPQNLFITYTGVVKLLDFGIAKAETNLVETRTGVIKGKYAYIAPEQAMAQTVDGRADLWSMGVVLWECLTSRRLFKSTNELATLQETLHREIQPPSTFNPAVPPELDAIVMRSLMRPAPQRFQSAIEFRSELERWLGTQSKPPTRRNIAGLMQEHFEEVQALQKERLQACLALLESASDPIVDHLALDPFGNMTPSSARKITGEIPAFTPTPSIEPPPKNAPVQEQGKASSAMPWRLMVVSLLVSLVGIAAFFLWKQGSNSEADTLRETSTTESGIAQAGSQPAAPATPAEPSSATEPSPAMDPIVITTAEPAAAEPTPAAEPAAAVSPTPSSDASSARSHTTRSSSRGEPGTTRTEPRADRAAAADPTPVEPQASAATDEQTTGFLSLVTSPWTQVSLGGRDLGTTPLVRVRLPVGHHVLRLVNEEAGISEQYEIDIRPSETTTRRLGLR
jgi:serine/threonine-protein kinase